jgi:hypothetical protein
VGEGFILNPVFSTMGDFHPIISSMSRRDIEFGFANPKMYFRLSAIRWKGFDGGASKRG